MAIATGCNRLSFIKPDYTRSDFRRTAPELDVVTDDRSKGAANARTAVQQGQLAYTRGDLAGARKAAVEALERSPEFAAAHTLRALVADAEGEVEVAGDHYRRAVELAPQDGGALNNYGTWLCANGREQESLQWFDRALADRGYRTPAAAMANAGACAVRAGQGGLAVKYLDAALGLEPRNPVALAAMAEHEFRAGRAFHARAFSQRRLAAAPADARSLLLASQIEEKLGDKDAAARYVQRLRAEFPDTSGSGAGENGKR
ncbi:type IV pilus biogenesis/stability protein PilW [Lysobacter sp. F6437]|uniref:type IV pilus biogenesis/stability protein PilW n=1 Tax=Lysobacter sp. F6437 TaxID=3459296 RepID=UPI00403D8425